MIIFNSFAQINGKMGTRHILYSPDRCPAEQWCRSEEFLSKKLYLMPCPEGKDGQNWQVKKTTPEYSVRNYAIAGAIFLAPVLVLAYLYKRSSGPKVST